MSRTLMALAGAACLGSMTVMPGCFIAHLVGGMAASAQRTGTHEVPAKYEGLEEKTFAVMVSTERVIQADNPEIVGAITVTVAQRLKDNCGASGFIPGQRVLEYQYQNPRWVAKSGAQLVEDLKVDRLVMIDLREFRLTDPGNRYVWAGIASGTVSVFERGASSDDPAFQEVISVKFPDDDGLTPQQIGADAVQISLAKRVCDRAAWLFYFHEEANSLEY